MMKPRNNARVYIYIYIRVGPLFRHDYTHEDIQRNAFEDGTKRERGGETTQCAKVVGARSEGIPESGVSGATKWCEIKKKKKERRKEQAG